MFQLNLIIAVRNFSHQLQCTILLYKKKSIDYKGKFLRSCTLKFKKIKYIFLPIRKFNLSRIKARIF
jgi:hypothetical protein